LLNVFITGGKPLRRCKFVSNVADYYGNQFTVVVVVFYEATDKKLKLSHLFIIIFMQQESGHIL